MQFLFFTPENAVSTFSKNNFSLSNRRTILQFNLVYLKWALVQRRQQNFWAVFTYGHFVECFNLYLWMAKWTVFTDKYFWKCSWAHAVTLQTESRLFLMPCILKARRYGNLVLIFILLSYAQRFLQIFLMFWQCYVLLMMLFSNSSQFYIILNFSTICSTRFLQTSETTACKNHVTDLLT